LKITPPPVLPPVSVVLPRSLHAVNEWRQDAVMDLTVWALI
jgi:hypothetical protein